MSQVQVNAVLALRGLRWSEKLVLLVLAGHAEEGAAGRLSIPLLAEISCLTQRSVRSILSTLHDRGLITRAPVFLAEGSRGPDQITIVLGGAHGH